jgi:hypothetical protein
MNINYTSQAMLIVIGVNLANKITAVILYECREYEHKVDLAFPIFVPLSSALSDNYIAEQPNLQIRLIFKHSTPNKLISSAVLSIVAQSFLYFT